MTEIINRKSFSKTILVFLFLVVSCNPTDQTKKNNPVAKVVTQKQGNLILVANGESFVRDGFITKDAWKIEFNKLTVSVGNVIAYQTETGFDPDQNQIIDSKLAIPLTKEIKVIDLIPASKPKNSISPSLTSKDLTIVKKIAVPVGSYRAISWEMAPKNDFGGETETIFLQGNATKNGKKINFELGFLLPIKYICGEFIGEERKGIVAKDKLTELEMTFHFDHLFGDSNISVDDALNQEALGFEPLAKLASAGSLKLDWQTLQQKLEPSDLEILTKAIAGLGHVGEGHCKAIYEE